MKIDWSQKSLILPPLNQLIEYLPQNNVFCFLTVVAMETRYQNFVEIGQMLSKEKLETDSFHASF